MQNTGTEYTSADKKPNVIAELRDLLPPLPNEQVASLEADIKAHGCYSPIIVDEELNIVDGHHRHKICEEHNVVYRMAVFSFEDMLEAKQWALSTQRNRRNLSIWDLGQIALKLKPDVEAKAEANKGARTDLRTTLSEGEFEPTDTKQEIAESVGISRGTMNKVIQIDEHAPTPIKEALDAGELSVNKGYNLTKQLKDVPEDEKEQAAAQAMEMEKAKKELKKADAETDRKGKIAKQFCTAFEKAILLEVTAENIDIWVECSRLTAEEVKDMRDEAYEIAEIFTAIAQLLEAKGERDGQVQANIQTQDTH